jgi:predicted component of type VI protein secretion system
VKEARYWLYVETGPEACRWFPLAERPGGHAIGRVDSDHSGLAVNLRRDLRVARRPVRLDVEAGAVFVTDQHTRNPTLLNGRAITGAVRLPLAAGDRLTVGASVLLLVDLDAG